MAMPRLPSLVSTRSSVSSASCSSTTGMNRLSPGSAAFGHRRIVALHNCPLSTCSSLPHSPMGMGMGMGLMNKPHPGSTTSKSSTFSSSSSKRYRHMAPRPPSPSLSLMGAPSTSSLSSPGSCSSSTSLQPSQHLFQSLHTSAVPLPRSLSAASSIQAHSMNPIPTMAQARRRYSPQHFYQNRILDPYVQQAVSPITLRQLVFFGRNMQPDKLLKSANYVRTELPVRLAHRIRDFQNLPFIVGTNPHIELVYDLYWLAFERLRNIPEIKTLEENDKFCDLVKGLLNDHLVVIPQLALGIMECSKHIPAQQVDQFMNKMLRSRISRRVLAEQHISLTSNYNSPNHMMTDRGYIGIIYTHCNPRDIVERTALLAAETCRQSCGGLEPPKIIMDGNIDAEFSYIPDHIEYILYELLKNSMRFVMLNGQRDSVTGELPPIQITVCEGTHDIVFRVSDKGGGIHPEMESHLWSYAQSPARFANFEKVSKMAATVQEQMVSPSRSVNAADGYDAEGDHAQADLDHLGTGADEAEAEVGDVILPPPPANRKSSYQRDEAALLLDRHAPPRMSSRKAASSASMSTSATSSTPSGRPSSDTKTIIDPSLQAAPPKKMGHLECESRQKAEQQQDQSMHLGIGLPMSRVYAEYWGGDLKVFTMRGYGTDAYARFCKFGNIYENFDV